MKKLFFSLLLSCLVFACSSVFASPVSSAFSAEDLVAENVIKGMTGNGSYVSVVAYFSDSLVKKYTEQQHKFGVEGLRKEFGTISDVRLVSCQRMYNKERVHQFDSVSYLAKSSKGQDVMIQLVFAPFGKDLKVVSVGFRAVELKEQRPAPSNG